MDQNVNYVGGGLICDNPNCDWEDTTIKDEDFPNWINKSCPKCGDNVLTENDYNNVLKLNKIVDYINSLSEEQLKKLSGNGQTSLNLNGDKILEKLHDLSSEKYDPNQIFSLTINTHGELKVSDVKRIEKNDGTDRQE